MNAPTLLRKMLLFAVLAAYPLFFASCNDNDDPNPSDKNIRQTVLMYMPWSGSGIYTYFLNNISAFETAITNNGGLDGNALMLFVSENETRSHLIRIDYKKGQCVRDTLKQYSFSNCNYTTSSGIATIINDAISKAPAQTYALAIGCHGMGWIPSGNGTRTNSDMTQVSVPRPRHLTRFFGHDSNRKYQTDITTLAKGITAAGVTMQYILFDDCYMSNIETAYDLKDVTNYFIASTCEMMIEGMPYAEIGIDLLNNNYSAVVDGFYSFYSTFTIPCGTIGVTDCHEVERMADIMKQINTAYPDGVNSLSGIQKLDGYTPTIFFDFGNYVEKLCEDENLLADFQQQLQALVPYKANTQTYYSAITDRTYTINAFSGLTISDPTINSTYKEDVTQTAWYAATH